MSGRNKATTKISWSTVSASILNPNVPMMHQCTADKGRRSAPSGVALDEQPSFAFKSCKSVLSDADFRRSGSGIRAAQIASRHILNQPQSPLGPRVGSVCERMRGVALPLRPRRLVSEPMVKLQPCFQAVPFQPACPLLPTPTIPRSHV
jgi:hypothetical protein